MLISQYVVQYLSINAEKVHLYLYLIFSFRKQICFKNPLTFLTH